MERKIMNMNWYVDGILLDTSKTKMDYSKEVRHVPYSVLFYCWKCGDPWGKIAVDHPDTRWESRPRECPRCGPGLMGMRDQDIYDMPQEVALREIPLMSKVRDYDFYLITGGK
jgi:hypothetical protein